MIALTAAYVIALSSLIASFTAAQAAVGTAGQPGGMICHTDPAGQPAPFPGDTNSKLCVDCCGAGCIMLLVALPPPPATAVAMLASPTEILLSPAQAAPVGATDTKAHRSRAPPLPV